MNWLTGDVQVLLEFDGDGDGTISIDELEGAVAAYQQMMQFSSSPSIESGNIYSTVFAYSDEPDCRLVVVLYDCFPCSV